MLIITFSTQFDYSENNYNYVHSNYLFIQDNIDSTDSNDAVILTLMIPVIMLRLQRQQQLFISNN